MLWSDQSRYLPGHAVEANFVPVRGEFSRNVLLDILAYIREIHVASVTFQAESYCMGLQQCGLTASIAPDAKFKGDESEDV